MTPEEKWAEAQAALTGLMARVNKQKPAPEAIDALRTLYRDVPNLANCFSQVARDTQEQLINTMLTKEADRIGMLQYISNMRKGMGYFDASTLEKGLIDHIITCWLRLRRTELEHHAATRESHTHSTGIYWERRYTMTQHRYLKAIESLARVRRLTQPAALQVNVGLQQVNTLGELSQNKDR